MADAEDPLDSIEKHLWTAKEFIKRKFGKTQDDYIAASDSQLDAKLEYFNSIRETSGDMMTALRAYHNIMYELSQKERDLSSLLRTKNNITKCDELQTSMNAVGKALRDSSQDRLEMRKHFSRLADEVTTFRKCAVTDCEETIRKMEAQRTQYRGALSWMRALPNLNPENAMNMNRYRRVQDRVKNTKKKFDIQKLTALEKVDLLAISRQGMFSQTLGGYITAIKLYHKHMATLYGDLSRDINLSTASIKFQTLKELNDLLPVESGTDAEQKPASAAVADAEKLPKTTGADKDPQAAATNLIVMDEDSKLKSHQQHSADLETLASNDNNVSAAWASDADFCLLNDTAATDDLFTGLDTSEVEALKEVFELSKPQQQQHQQQLLHSMMPNMRTADVAAESGLFDVLSLLQQQQQQQSSGNMSNSNKLSSSKVVESQNESSTSAVHSKKKQQQAIGSKSKQSNAADSKTDLNLWYKLLEQANLFEDESECFLPQNNNNTSRRSSLASTAAAAGAGNPQQSAGSSVENSPGSIGKVAGSGAAAATEHVSAGGADKKSSTERWLIDDSIA